MFVRAMHPYIIQGGCHVNSQYDARKPMGIWIRVSTEDQAKGDSPEHHEHRARCYAEAKDWEVATVYHLEGVGGELVADHPEYRRMTKDIETGKIKGLIFSKLARVARNTKHLLELSDFFRKHDADLVSLQESIDTSTPAGRLFYTMIAAMAQWEREEIADRVKASVSVRANLGKHIGGTAPFGYQWVDKKLIPNPDEAPMRKRIYELFREHRRLKTVARLMNEAGYLTRRGKQFCTSTIEHLIQDTTPKGLHRANYQEKVPGKNSKRLKPESEWVYREVEPIIPEELWAECNAIITEGKKTRKKRSKPTAHLFSGLLYCGCGEKMYVPWKSRKYVCQKCRNKIPIDEMEDIFIEQLRSFFISPEAVQSYLDEANSTRIDQEADIARLRREIAEITQQLDGLFELYNAGQVPTDGFKGRYQPLYDRQKELEPLIAEAEAALDLLKVESLSQDVIRNEGQTLSDHWPLLNSIEKRQVVEDLVDEVTIDGDDVALNICYFPKEVANSSNTP